MDKNGEFPKNFVEKQDPASIEAFEFNQKFGANSFGEGFRFKANWFQTDDDEKVVATKTAQFNVIAQLGNGIFVNTIQETVKFNQGDSFETQGLFVFGGTINLSVKDGTGRFKNLRGVESVKPTSTTLPLTSNISLNKLDIKGTAGNDNISGTNESEFIAGKKGNDTINGGQGDDVIEGDQGSDVIRGGAGNDVLAADRVYRFRDKDGSHSELRGDNGDDTIYGGNQKDFIGGGNDNDILFGKRGDDLILGGSGFDLLKKIDQIDFKVIFVTAYNSYALKAIKFSALDYILKPIDPEELIEAVDKLDQLRYQNESLDLLRENLTDQGSGKIALHTQDEIHFVEIGDIVRLEASANYTKLFLSDKSTLLLSKNLGFYEKLLQDSSFFRSHQSHLINLDYAAKYVKKDGGYLLMTDDQIVPVSRLKKEEIKILFRF